MNIFVYGTLMKSGWNSDLLGECPFLGEYKTMPTHDLMVEGMIPFLIPQGEYAVWGEVYEVTPYVLVALDFMEGHPEWYLRAPVELQDCVHAVEGYTYPRDLGTPTRAPLATDGALKWRDEI